MNVYPNPSSKMVTVDVNLQFSSGSIELSVLDVLGRYAAAPIKAIDTLDHAGNQRGVSKQWSVDVSALKPGIYYIRLKSAGVVKTTQIQVL